MTEPLGRAELELSTNQSKLDTGLKQAETKSLGFLGRVKDSFSRLSGSTIGSTLLQGIGLGAGMSAFGVIQAGLGKTVEFFGDAVQAAGVFQDTVSATGIIFSDEFTPALEEWAEKAHSAFGASKQDALDAANSIAVFGKSAGLAGQDLVGFSTELVQLGGDLASMFGGSTQDAITAVGAALRGEMEPIRRYGVLLDDATLRQKAFEMGLISTTTQALKPQQRVLAAHAAIMAQTSDAQGNFALTSDDLMNVQRDLGAQFENLTIKIGERLLPIMVSLARFARDNLIPALEGLVNVLDEIGDAVVDENRAAGLERLYARFEKLPDLANTATQLREGVAKVIEAGTQGVAYAAKTAWSPIHEQLVEARRKTAAEALAIPGDIAKALIQGMDDVESGMDELTDLMENSLSDAAKIARLKGILSSKELAAGLRDERADVRASAMQIRDDALEQLQLLESGAADAAVDAGTTFAEQLRLQAVAAGQAANDIKRGVQGNLEFTDEATSWSEAVADAWSAGLSSPVSLANASARARALAGAVSPYLEGYSPPKEGPLQHIDRWGGNIIGAWIDSMLSRLGDVTSAGSKIAERARAALSIDRLAVPAFALAAPGMGAAFGQDLPGAREIHYHYELTVDGMRKEADNRTDFMQELDALSPFGGDGRMSGG